MVSPGLSSTRWKIIQQCGRLGRDAGSQAVFIMVHERSRRVRGGLTCMFVRIITASAIAVIKKEAEEYKKVQEIFKGPREAAGCFRKRLFDSFKIQNPTGTRHLSR
jgi:hypothetical protein